MGTYLPWFELGDDRAAEQITVRHLLGHASGLSDLQYVDTWRVPDDATIEDGVRDLVRARPIDPPGTTFHYFNPGYATLGLIVETISGQSYADYLQTQILEPLEMRRTFTDPEAAEAAGLAKGHTLLFGFPVEVDQPFRQYGLPAGYLMSTANDLARFLAAMANWGKLDGMRVLSLTGMMQLHAPMQPSGFYAMGWFVGEHRGMRLVQHGGSNELFKSEAMVLPYRDLGLVVLIDQGYLPSALHAYPHLSYGLLDIVAGMEPGDPGWPMRWFGWGLLGLAVVQLGLFGRAMVRLRTWTNRARRWHPVRRWLDVVLHVVLMPAIALGIILAMRVTMGRGTSWLGAFAAVPDAALLALFAYAADLGQAAFKGVALATGRLPPDPSRSSRTSAEIRSRNQRRRT